MKYYITPLSKEINVTVRKLRLLVYLNKITVPHKDKKGYAYWLKEDIPKLLEELSTIKEVPQLTTTVNMFKNLCQVLYATPEYLLDYKKHTDDKDALASPAVIKMLDEVLVADKDTKKKLIDLCNQLVNNH